MPITIDDIKEFRKLQGQGYTSAVGEYTPSAFWEALDEIERLHAKVIDLSNKAYDYAYTEKINVLRAENEQLKQLNRANVEACDRWNDRLRSEIEQLQNLRNQQSAALEKTREAMQHFVDKVETGRAQSRESYAQFKAALAAIEELKK